MTQPLCPGVLDVSHWDSDQIADLQPHLAAAKADGVIAVIAKATQGKDAVDTAWARWAREIQKAGLLIGAYHFISSSSTGDVQAEWFLKHVRDVGLDPKAILLAVDFEKNPNNPALQATTENARQFVREIQRVIGRWPVFYGYQSMLGGLITDPNDDLVKCPLWLAAYGSSAEVGPKLPPGYVKAGKSWVLWQYSDGQYSAVHLPKDTDGFSHMDRSVFKGTPDDLRKAWPGFGG